MSPYSSVFSQLISICDLLYNKTNQHKQTNKQTIIHTNIDASENLSISHQLRNESTCFSLISPGVGELINSVCISADWCCVCRDARMIIKLIKRIKTTKHSALFNVI